MLRLPLRSALRARAPFGTIGVRWTSTAPSSANVLDELERRGFVADVTSPELRTHLTSPSCVYAGVDPSASSLHVGNLLPLLGLLHFRARGHRAVALIGGATGSIGDPSGRSTERNALSEEQLAVNVAGITAQIERFFDRGIKYADARGYGGKKATEGEKDGDVKEVTVVNNYDWFKNVTFLDFLRDVGKLARVNTMLARESVKSRLDSESGISFTEFSYQLLQAHDFATLYKTQACRIQLGGSDQWGNIVAGIDMIKRQRANEVRAAEAAAEATAKAAGAAPLTRSEKRALAAKQKAEAAALEAAKVAREQGEELFPEMAEALAKFEQAQALEAAQAELQREPAFGLTIPLLTTSTGEKFGKSAGNAVWLDEGRTSVFDFYQFFIRTPDADVAKYLSLLTLVPTVEIEAIMKKHAGERSARHPQKLLAREVTELVHGADAVARAETMSNVLFTTEPRKLKAADVLAAFEGNPRLVRLHRRELKGKPVSKLAVEYGLVSSRAEANRLIKPRHSGLSVNEREVTDPRSEIVQTDLIDGHLAILKRGTRDMVVFYVDQD